MQNYIHCVQEKIIDETEISCLELEVSGMVITNYITRPDCVNWIECFVCKVLEEADIHFNNVIIIEISFSEKFILKSIILNTLL